MNLIIRARDYRVYSAPDRRPKYKKGSKIAEQRFSKPHIKRLILRS